jgi:hypothetical protein
MAHQANQNDDWNGYAKHQKQYGSHLVLLQEKICLNKSCARQTLRSHVITLLTPESCC